MQINIELTEKDVKDLIIADLSKRIGLSFNPAHLDIKVKSKQNYKSEWETASFKAVYSHNEIKTDDIPF